jgi:hypothetical protein
MIRQRAADLVGECDPPQQHRDGQQPDDPHPPAAARGSSWRSRFPSWANNCVPVIMKCPHCLKKFIDPPCTSLIVAGVKKRAAPVACQGRIPSCAAALRIFSSCRALFLNASCSFVNDLVDVHGLHQVVEGPSAIPDMAASTCWRGR